VTAPLASLAARDRKRLERRDQPRSVQPMKAVLTDRPFSDERWIFEPKLDGIRCIALRSGKEVRLASRTRKSLNDSYPELVDALEREGADDFVVDGEIVAFERGVTSFSRLQRRMQIQDPARARRSGVAVFLYLFDLLHLAGHDTAALPLRRRKALLRKALSFKGPVRFMSHRNRDGEAYYHHACQRGWEGVIAKRADSTYQHRRSGDWLKFKCSNQQEFVIGGYTAPQGSRTGFGALLLGYYRDGELAYAGKVGTGFDDATLERLGRRLSRLARNSSPFASDGVPSRGVIWVSPELVAQIGFTEWTRDGRLRHPRFLGLRDDKRPREVVREEPRAA
jgi:bifunctional non-homologous end joining protein LigD